MKIVILLTCLFGGWRTSSAQTRLMTRVFGSQGFDSAAGVAVDRDGNVFVAGTAGDTLDGQKIAGTRDILLVKYGPDGKRHWTRLVGTDGEDLGRGVAVDAHGNAYVTGWVTRVVKGREDAGQQTDGILVPRPRPRKRN